MAPPVTDHVMLSDPWMLQKREREEIRLILERKKMLHSLYGNMVYDFLEH